MISPYLSIPFIALSLAGLAFSLWMAFESIAIITNTPTLSALAHLSGPVQHSVWTYFIVGLVCFVLGGLIVHITGWNA